MTAHSPLLARYRRYWSLFLLGVLAVPMTVAALQPVAVSSDEEARMLSPAPSWPQSAQDWRALPRRLDRFLADHFGLRTELVRAHGRLRYAVHLPSDLRVIIGRDNWLFLNGDATIEQATGKLLRESEIAKFADRAGALRTRLAGRNIRLLVAIPRTARRSIARACPLGRPTLRLSPNTISCCGCSRPWTCARRSQPRTPS